MALTFGETVLANVTSDVIKTFLWMLVAFIYPLLCKVLEQPLWKLVAIIKEHLGWANDEGAVSEVETELHPMPVPTIQQVSNIVYEANGGEAGETGEASDATSFGQSLV